MHGPATKPCLRCAPSARGFVTRQRAGSNCGARPATLERGFGIDPLVACSQIAEGAGAAFPHRFSLSVASLRQEKRILGLMRPADALFACA